jgi:hypothetical protein
MPPPPPSNPGQQAPNTFFSTVLNTPYSFNPNTTPQADPNLDSEADFNNPSSGPAPYAPFVPTAPSSIPPPPRASPRASRYEAERGASYKANRKEFNQTKRSLQARGKNYNLGGGAGSGKEYEERQRRDEALAVLESDEVLMWLAAARNEVCSPLPHPFCLPWPFLSWTVIELGKSNLS